MPATKEHVEGGIEFLMKKINGLKQDGPIYILFCGSKNEKGDSWCPDCVKAEPVVYDAASKLPSQAVLIHCDVGPRDEWKSPANPFRTNENCRLTAVPTLIKWKTPKRLVEDECWDPELLAMMFEGD